MTPAIELADLNLRYRGVVRGSLRPPISSLNLSVFPGEIVVVIGAAGAGKSTLLGALAPTDRRDPGMRDLPRVESGSIRILDRRLRAWGSVRRRLSGRVGWVPQDVTHILRAEDGACETIAAPVLRRDSQFDREELSRMVRELAIETGIEPGDINRLPGELSTGNRQRVAIAQALILDPAVIIADEPLSGVDITERPALMGALRARADRGAAVLLASNQRDVVTGLADRVVVLESGALIAQGSLNDLRQTQPAGGFLSSMLAH